MQKINRKTGNKIASLVNQRDVAKIMLAERLSELRLHPDDDNAERTESVKRWEALYNEATEELRNAGIPIVA